MRRGPGLRGLLLRRTDLPEGRPQQQVQVILSPAPIQSAGASESAERASCPPRTGAIAHPPIRTTCVTPDAIFCSSGRTTAITPKS